MPIITDNFWNELKNFDFKKSLKSGYIELITAYSEDMTT